MDGGKEEAQGTRHKARNGKKERNVNEHHVHPSSFLPFLPKMQKWVVAVAKYKKAWKKKKKQRTTKTQPHRRKSLPAGQGCRHGQAGSVAGTMGQGRARQLQACLSRHGFSCCMQAMRSSSKTETLNKTNPKSAPCLPCLPCRGRSCHAFS